MRKFLIGCAGIIGVLLLLGLVGSWVLIRQLQKELPDLEQLDEQQDELRARFGPIDEFVPPLDGRVVPERMEVYLTVRQALPSDDTGFLQALHQVSDQGKRVEEAKGFRKLQEMYRVAKQGMGVARVAMDYLVLRDSLLLAEEMGPGEYVHYTSLGPILGLEFDPERCGPDVGDRVSPEAAEDLESSRDHILSLFREQLENARRELRGLEIRSEAQEAYLEALEFEFENQRIGEHPRPFAGGLPLVTKESLDPYRDRLRASLPRCKETWSLELLVAANEDERGVQVKLNERDDD